MTTFLRYGTHDFLLAEGLEKPVRHKERPLLIGLHIKDVVGLLLGYLVHDRRLRPNGIDRDCLSLNLDEVEELLYGVDFIGLL